jgi:hypothetical protein
MSDIYCPDHLRDILIAIAATVYITHAIYMFILGIISAHRAAKEEGKSINGEDIFLSYVQAMTWPVFYYRMWRRYQSKP